MESSYRIPSKSCSKKKHLAFWTKIMFDQTNSGMSMVKFCQLHSLKYTTFKSYKYSKRNIKTQNENAANRFIPLEIAGDIFDNRHHEDRSKGKAIKYESIKPEPIDRSVAKIKIVFKNGHEVILPSVLMNKDGLLAIIKAVAGL